MIAKNTKEIEEDGVVWTPNMPDRRRGERRAGLDRRQCQGKPVNIPDVRSGGDRRQSDRRVGVKLTITGRAMDA